MELYKIRRKRNGQFSKRGKVVKVRKIVKPSYWDTFNWGRLAIAVLILLGVIILGVTIWAK